MDNKQILEILKNTRPSQRTWNNAPLRKEAYSKLSSFDKFGGDKHTYNRVDKEYYDMVLPAIAEIKDTRPERTQEDFFKRLLKQQEKKNNKSVANIDVREEADGTQE